MTGALANNAPQTELQEVEVSAMLTSTTAPNKVFASRSELAAHYKSDWHKYNLKRREAGMPVLKEEDFHARLEAALALRREREGRAIRNGKNHLKDRTADRVAGDLHRKKTGLHIVEKKVHDEESIAKAEDPDDKETIIEDETKFQSAEETPVINPYQSLFDSHVSSTVLENADYMQKKYGFFLPDSEYLTDMEGLIGYCSEKVKLGHYCLYCQRTFKTWNGCVEHMVKVRHTKLRYEAGVDLDEFAVFYDFSEANAEYFLTASKRRQAKTAVKTYEDVEDNIEACRLQEDDNDDDDNDGEWEDIDSDDDVNMEDASDEKEDDGMYAAYRDEISKHGFDVTPLGELILPDGRIVGHRGLARYYKQRFAPEGNGAAVAAARHAAGERLLNGRIYDIHAPMEADSSEKTLMQASGLTVAKASLVPGTAPGRTGKGILVPVTSVTAGRSAFTALSLYRYRAAVQKGRKEEQKGRRLQERTLLPMNKMDKKGNRMTTGVSVAHAPR